MKGKWKVLKNPMAGYIASRIRDTSKPMHSGNLEYYGEYSDSEDEIKAVVDGLNAEVDE